MQRSRWINLVILLLIAGAAVFATVQYFRGSYAQGSGTVTYAPDTTLPAPRYYTGIDFDTLRSNDHLTVIPLKSFRQQVTNYTCGPVAAMTVLSYYHTPVANTDAEEWRLPGR